jgi:3-phenylpropionate/cinnamic acid dioxygenase small subunit
MADMDLSAQVAQFLYAEALFLDERRWDEWLSLYEEDAVFWVPSYTMQGAPVTDPELSINLIYITSRAGLEDRIYRIRTGTSEASIQLPHICHQISNVTAEAGDENGLVTAAANFMVSAWSHRRGQEFRSGRYEYRLSRGGDGLLIAYKKVLPIEEVTDGWFDVVSI